MDIKCRVYDIPEVMNIRDIGGYTAKDGRVTAHGRFIRSTALNNLSPKGESELLAIGIDCVIDLRSKAERLRAPDVIERNPDMHYTHVPMLDYIQSSLSTGDYSVFPASMYEMYTGLLDKAAGEFKTVFEVFAADRFNSYIFHCTAGKDRTGITAMLLLGLAGVDDEIIIEDYSYTEVLMGWEPVTDYPGMPLYLFRSEPDTMRSALTYLREKYGGVSQYLSHIGVDGGKQEKILQKLFR